MRVAKLAAGKPPARAQFSTMPDNVCGGVVLLAGSQVVPKSLTLILRGEEKKINRLRCVDLKHHIGFSSLALSLCRPGLISCACPCSTRGSRESLSPSPPSPDPAPRPAQTCYCVEEVRGSALSGLHGVEDADADGSICLHQHLYRYTVKAQIT